MSVACLHFHPAKRFERIEARRERKEVIGRSMKRGEKEVRRERERSKERKK